MKFNDLYKQIICESVWGSSDDGYPRPSRLKTPPNEYGDTGHNAKYYDMYVQDQAEDIYVDKYGYEKGHAAWERIIYIGNAMWKACDQILGQKRTMGDYYYGFKHNHPEIPLIPLNDNSHYILLWANWLLMEVVDGVRTLTQDYISECLPLFNKINEKFDNGFTPLMEAAGITKDFQISKKIQARLDAEAAAKRAAEEEQQRKIAAAQAAEVQKKDLTQQILAIIPNADSRAVARLVERIRNKTFDISVGLGNLLNLPQPAGKDQQRIFDIVLKSNNGRPSLLNVDLYKMESLASTMNSKITGDVKRNARRDACIYYGLPVLANIFQ